MVKKENINSRNIKYFIIVDYNEYSMMYFKMPNNKWYRVSENHQLTKIDDVEVVGSRIVDSNIKSMKEQGLRYIFGPGEKRKFKSTRIKRGEEQLFYDTKVMEYAKYYFRGKGSLSTRANR